MRESKMCVSVSLTNNWAEQSSKLLPFLLGIAAMPAFWISLDGLPKTPCGIGVTASNESKAIELVESFGIYWHREAPSSNIEAVENLELLRGKIIPAAIKRPIHTEGIWFPVFDIESEIEYYSNLTARLRKWDCWQVVRDRLDDAGVEFKNTIASEMRWQYEGNKILLFLEDLQMQDICMDGTGHAEHLTIEQINELEIEPCESDLWMPDAHIRQQILNGSLKQQFEDRVKEIELTQVNRPYQLP